MKSLSLELSEHGVPILVVDCDQTFLLTKQGVLVEMPDDSVRRVDLVEELRRMAFEENPYNVQVKSIKNGVATVTFETPIEIIKNS